MVYILLYMCYIPIPTSLNCTNSISTRSLDSTCTADMYNTHYTRYLMFMPTVVYGRMYVCVCEACTVNIYTYTHVRSLRLFDKCTFLYLCLYLQYLFLVFVLICTGVIYMCILLYIFMHVGACCLQLLLSLLTTFTLEY